MRGFIKRVQSKGAKRQVQNNEIFREGAREQVRLKASNRKAPRRRTLAETLINDGPRVRMLDIAKDYDSLAAQADVWEREDFAKQWMMPPRA
jgi:hypothetical protein